MRAFFDNLSKFFSDLTWTEIFFMTGVAVLALTGLACLAKAMGG